MSENGGSELTQKQMRAVAALLKMRTINEAATMAKIAPRTLYRWMDLPEFQSALRDAQSASLAGHIRELTVMLEGNRTTMIEIRDDRETPAHVRLRACELIEKSLLGWRESIEFEHRLQLLEEVLEPDAEK